jgi:hypothetical protein
MRKKMYIGGALFRCKLLNILFISIFLWAHAFVHSSPTKCSNLLKKYLVQNRPLDLPNLAEDYDAENNVPIFDAKKISEHQLAFADNQIDLSRSGKSISKLIRESSFGRFIFVVTKNNQIIASLKNDELVHHSSIAGGQSVSFAGEMVLKKNKSSKYEIQLIINQSGHYQTPAGRNTWMIQFLKSVGGLSDSLVVKEFDFPFGVEFPYREYLAFNINEPVDRKQLVKIVFEKTLEEVNPLDVGSNKVLDSITSGKVMDQALLNLIAEKSRNGNAVANKVLKKLVATLKKQKQSPSQFIQYFGAAKMADKEYQYMPVKSFVEDIIVKSMDSMENLEHFVDVWSSVK